MATRNPPISIEDIFMESSPISFKSRGVANGGDVVNPMELIMATHLQSFIDPDSAYGIAIPNIDLDLFSSATESEDSDVSEIIPSKAMRSNVMDNTKDGANSRRRRSLSTEDSDPSYTTHAMKRRRVTNSTVKAGTASTSKKSASKSRKSMPKLGMDQRELKKLKNREAAARCRNRRKQLIEDLSVQTNSLESENDRLQDEVTKLNKRVIELEEKLQISQSRTPIKPLFTCQKCCGTAQLLDTFESYIAEPPIWQQKREGSVISVSPDLNGSVTTDAAALEFLFNETIGNQSLDLTLYQSPEELASLEHEL